ncbi:MAG TPA: hypothetical protein GXX48_01925 [Ochrobactrum intermedium]|uniref:Uncharacterized protein n=1 Tax=Brucella intermedia TaxID=94625 RepID=A0A7V6TY11_9HYPH|nr:hypothetical protein [Brucella intermedia]HHV66398.1 hypothetical protein [Brucella intermedia]
MNLRTLKKLSKRAAPLLPLLGENRQQFRSAHARTGENYHHTFIGDRKHWERSRCHPSYEARNGWAGCGNRGAEIVYQTRAGHTVVVRPPVHPRKGTVMVGGMSGYYEPEWDEEDAWSALECIVCHHFSEWDEELETFYLTRPLPTVTSIFQAADEIIAELKRGASR